MNISTDTVSVLKRRRIVDIFAGMGMIVICVALFLPLLNMLDTEQLYTFRWLFAAGALMYWVARCIPVNLAGESMRLRRLRRMEFWSGACFGVAAFFWFYNISKYGRIPTTGALMILRDTILFTLAGAVIQLVASWLIYFRARKDAKEEAEKATNKRN